MANPIQAMGRAIAKIDAFEVPALPRTTFNVGRVGGGTSVNAIPFECWMEVDMRSSDKTSLEAVNTKFKAAVAQAIEEENKRWSNRGAVSVSNELVGVLPRWEHFTRFRHCDHGHRGLQAVRLFRPLDRRFYRRQRSDEPQHSFAHHRRGRDGDGRAFRQRNLRHYRLLVSARNSALLLAVALAR